MAPECVEAFNELKLGKTIKYVIFKLSDDYKEIVVEHKSTDSDWESFRTKILSATASSKGKEGKGPRYAVYDFEYELQAGEGKRYESSGCTWVWLMRCFLETRFASSIGPPMRVRSSWYGLSLPRCGLSLPVKQPKMTYASSKEALKNALSGIGAEVQANGEDEIEYETILKDISKGKR